MYALAKKEEDFLIYKWFLSQRAQAW